MVPVYDQWTNSLVTGGENQREENFLTRKAVQTVQNRETVQLREAAAEPDYTRQQVDTRQSDSDAQKNAIQLSEEEIDLKTKELEENFSYDGYQMVRKELFAHLRDPAVTIRADSTTFNTACISGLEDVVYVHLMINVDKKMMAVRAADENAKDALRWCIAKPDKRKSRKITSRKFSAMLYSLMGWSVNCRYKIQGYKIEVGGQYIYVFDLSETEIFAEKPRKKKATADVQTTDKPTENSPTAETAVDTRTPYFPESWKDTFGLPVEEHKKALDISIVDGFAVFGESQGEESAQNTAADNETT